MLNRTTAGLLSTLLGAALLAGCSGDSDSSSPEVEESASATTASSALAVPEGTELTPEGSTLAVGDAATLAWEPRQDTVGVIDVTVTRLEKTTFKKSFVGWKIDDATKKTSPYFVRGTVTNAGETDLSGRRIPLYVVDGANRLVDYSSFGSTFTPCPSTDLPKKFVPGEKTSFCLVYLVPDQGDLTAVSFRPTQEVNPITWTGELKSPQPLKADKPGTRGDKNKGKNGKKNKNGS